MFLNVRSTCTDLGISFLSKAKIHFTGQQWMTKYVCPYLSSNVLFIACHKMFHWTFVVGLYRILMLPVT